MRARYKPFILLVMASTAVTCNAKSALSDPARPPANVPHVSPALSPLLKAAQHALQANPPELQEALAKLQEVEASPTKTPYDEHIINALAGAVYAHLKDYPDAEKAFAAQVDDGFTLPADLLRITKAVSQINYQLKNYARAAEFGSRALSENAEDGELYSIVSQAYYLNGQHDAVREFLGKRIESLDRQGRDVPRQYLQLIWSSCVKLQDSACMATYSKRLGPRQPPGPRQPILIDPELKHDPTFLANASSQ